MRVCSILLFTESVKIVRLIVQYMYSISNALSRIYKVLVLFEHAYSSTLLSAYAM